MFPTDSFWEAASLRSSILDHTSPRIGELVSDISFPHLLSINTEPPVRGSWVLHWLTNLLTSPTYLCPGGTVLLSQASLSPSCERSLPQKTKTSLCLYHISQPESSAGPQFSWSWHQVSFHKKTRAHLVKMCYIQARDQNLSTEGKENLCIQLAWRLEQSKHSSTGHTAHTGVTSRSARPWAPRDLFFIRPLFSGAGDTTSFSNT